MAEKPKICDAPASYRSNVWKYFGFPEVNGVADRTKTICKIWYVNISYNQKKKTKYRFDLYRIEMYRIVAHVSQYVSYREVGVSLHPYRFNSY